uniref:PH domain-containing protein n=1 Tax=Schistocephalus solidus TaxID=70667 RepID=A0A0X3NTY0_SCHSO
MSHPIDRISFTFSAPGLNRSLSKLRTSFEGVHRASPSAFSLQSLRQLFNRRCNLHSPDIAKSGVVGEDAFCDGCLHVTQDRLCFVWMPSDRQPALLASWIFDSGNLLAYGTGRFAMHLPPFTPNQQHTPEAEKSCRLAFYLISSMRMRNAPGLHIFVCDRAAEVSQWIQRATRPTCLLHERRWVTSIVSQLGSQNMHFPLSPPSWRQRCFSGPVASSSNGQSRPWTTLDSSRSPRQSISHGDLCGQQQMRRVTLGCSDDQRDDLSPATENLPADLTYPRDLVPDSGFLLLPPTKSNSSLFDEPQRPESSAKESSVGRHPDPSPTSRENLLGKLSVPKQVATNTGACESTPVPPVQHRFDWHDSAGAADKRPDQHCAIETGGHTVFALPSTSFTPSPYPPTASPISPGNPTESYRRAETFGQPMPRRPPPCRLSAPVISPAPSTHTATSPLRNSLIWPTSVSTVVSPASRNRAISESFTASAACSSNYRRLLSPSTLSSLGELSLDQLTQVCSSAYWEAAPLTAKPRTGHLYVSRDEVLQAAHHRLTQGWRPGANDDSGGRPPAGEGDNESGTARSFPHRGHDDSSYTGITPHRQRRSAPGRDPLQSAVSSEADGSLPTSSASNFGLPSHERRRSPEMQTTSGQSVCPYVNVVVDVITTSTASVVSPRLSTTPSPFVPRPDPENYLRPILTDVHAVGGHSVPRWSQSVPRFAEYLNVGRPIPTAVVDANVSYLSRLDDEDRRLPAADPSTLSHPTVLELPRHSGPPLAHLGDSEKPFASASLSVAQLNYTTLAFPQSSPQQPFTDTSQGNSHLADLTGAGSSRPNLIPRSDEMVASTMVPASGAGRSQLQGCAYVIIDCVSTHALSQMVHELADPPEAQPSDVPILREVTTPEPPAPRTLMTLETVDGELHRPASRRSACSRGLCGILLSTETDIELTTYVNPAGCSSGSTRVSSQSDHLRSRLERFCLRTTR